MDNLTHTLFGATLARAGFAGRGRGTTAALLLASNAPDIDIVAAVDGALNYLAWHRGPTHGPLGVVGLGGLVAAIAWSVQRTADRRHRADQAPFSTLAAASLVGVLCHVLMDLPTSYGTRLFSPFDWHWYAVDLIPIADVYLLLALLAGLTLGGRWAPARRRLALLVLALMVLNYGVRTVAHRRAIETTARVLAPILPEPCPDAVRPGLLDWWPRERAGDRRERGVQHCLVEIAAVPTFFSPFRWHAIARLSDSYHTLDLDLLDAKLDRSGINPPDDREAPWRRAERWSDHWTPAVMRAAQGEVGRVFLDFSRFPAARSELGALGRTTVSWTDLRFAGPGPRSLSERRDSLFAALVVVDRSGAVVAQGLGEE